MYIDEKEEPLGERPHEPKLGVYKIVRNPGEDTILLVEPDGSSYILPVFYTLNHVLRTILQMPEERAMKAMDWVWNFGAVLLDTVNDRMTICRKSLSEIEDVVDASIIGLLDVKDSQGEFSNGKA